MKVMMVAGGTGGHIYPALALADILVRQDPSSEVVFFGSNDRLEAKIIPEKGYRFIGADMESTSGGIVSKVRSVLSLLHAEQSAVKILRKEKPDICIGFGNYISVPLIRQHIACIFQLFCMSRTPTPVRRICILERWPMGL